MTTFVCALCQEDIEIDEMPEYNPDNECLVCDACANVLYMILGNDQVEDETE